jgi:golgi phosphoprotein 3
MQTLAEDLLLLALDDDRGTVSWQRATALPYGLGGALLLDLARLGRVTMAGDRVTLRNPEPTGEEVLDAALETIRTSKKARDAKHWVRELGGRSGLKEQLARRLVARSILREQEHTFLWVFHDPRFPTSDPSPEAEIRVRIRDVVLNGAGPDERTLLLLSLANACDLTGDLFSKEERKQAKPRIKELIEGERVGQAVGRAVQEVNAAVMAAVATSAAVSATASGAHH